jgi:hypothetical protein
MQTVAESVVERFKTLRLGGKYFSSIAVIEHDKNGVIDLHQPRYNITGAVRVTVDATGPQQWHLHSGPAELDRDELELLGAIKLGLLTTPALVRIVVSKSKGCGLTAEIATAFRYVAEDLEA